jgi:hypothetical protein
MSEDQHRQFTIKLESGPAVRPDPDFFTGPLWAWYSLYATARYYRPVCLAIARGVGNIQLKG